MEPLTFVLAMADDGAIGLGGALPWDIPEDRRFFVRATLGHAVIMGRRTWEEVGAPLRGRRNIVVSRTPGLVLDGAEVVPSIEAAIASARTTDPDPRVIGGAAIFETALPYATRILLTEVHRTVAADTYLALDRTGFREVGRARGSEDPTIELVTLERIEAPQSA